MNIELSEMASIFKALSSEPRLKILRIIYECGCVKTDDSNQKVVCVEMDQPFTTACECMDLSRSTISHHIKELQKAGLITCERKGRSFHCQVNTDKIALISDYFK